MRGGKGRQVYHQVLLSCLLLMLPIGSGLIARSVSQGAHPIAGNVASPQTSQDTGQSFERYPLNVTLFRLVNSHHTAWLDNAFHVLFFLGSGWVLLFIVPATYRFRQPKLKPLLIAIAIETVLIQIIKPLCDQPRPATLLSDVHLLYPYFQHAFPSGDAAMAFVVAFILARGERIWVQIAWFGYAALVAYERIYIGVHFPLDVLAGAAIGGVAASIAWLFVRKRAEEAPSTGAPVAEECGA